MDAAQAALDAQLVRRAAALLHVVEAGAAPLRRIEADRYEQVATLALATVGFDREGAETLWGMPSPIWPSDIRTPATPRPANCTRPACG